jgi:hypothetical protein
MDSAPMKAKIDSFGKRLENCTKALGLMRTIFFAVFLGVQLSLAAYFRTLCILELIAPLVKI